MRYRRRSHRDYDDDDPDLIGETLAAVNDRLDDLARQVSRLSRRSPGDDRDAPSSISEALDYFDRRLDRIAAERSGPRVTGDTTGEAATSAASASPAIVERTQDLGGLEDQLRNITEQLAALHQPCRIDDAVLTLRNDLAEIGRAFNAAMPRQAIEALEKEVRALSERVDRSRDSGADVAKLAQLERGLAEVRDTLRNLKPAEHLVEVNQTVKNLTLKIDQMAAANQNPAALHKLDQAVAGLRVIVSHVASNDTVGKLADEVRGLSSRFENAIAESGAKALSSFDRRIAALVENSSSASPELKAMIQTLGEQINDVQGRVAQPARGDAVELKAMIRTLGEQINDVQGRVAQPVQDDSGELKAMIQMLGEQINDVQGRVAQPTQDDSGELKAMIQTLGEQIGQAQVRHAQLAQSDAPELKAMIQTLGEQINQAQAHHAQLSQGDKLALGSIEDRIVKLSQKLDASDAWLARMGAIERGIAEMLMHLEAQRRIKALEAAKDRVNGASMATAPMAAAPMTAASMSVAPMAATAEAALAEAALAESKSAEPEVQAPEAAEESYASPEPSQVMSPDTQPMSMETIVTTAQAPNLAPNGGHSVAVMSSAADSPDVAAPQVQTESLFEQARRPINPDLPPDTPIEPNPDSTHIRSAADRIMASEAALGPAKPAAREVASQFETLIAARRAAFAAGAEITGASVPPFKPVLAQGAETPDPKKKGFGTYLRRFLVVISIFVIALAAAWTAMEMWPSAEPSAPTRTNMPSATPDGGQNPSAMPIPDAVPETPPQDGQANPPLNNSPSNNSMPAPLPNPVPMPMPLPESPPNGSSAPEPLGDAGRNSKTTPEVTGALTRLDPRLNRGPVDLPITLGGPTLRAAALAGNPAAEYEVAVRYAEGRGVTANIEEAARWLERAAKAGFVPAQFRLGGLYDKGGGLKKDRAVARALYTAAADKGHAKAMHNLAVLHAEGIDGKPNYRAAAQWFRKAAEYGIADSQYNLAILYIRGIGIEQNLVESYKWFALAAAQGDQEAAKKRDEVAERIDEQTLNAAQAAVQSFKVAQQPEQAVGLRRPAGGWDRANANAEPTNNAPARPKNNPPGPDSPLPNSRLTPAPL